MIFLSPGHHPSKPGAVFNGFAEHDEAVRWVECLYAHLASGSAVKVPALPLTQKVPFINSRLTPASIAVEVHFNAAKIWKDENGNDKVDEGEMVNVGRGCETLFFPGSVEGEELAIAVQTSMAGVLPPNRGVKEGWYRMDPKFGPDYFLEKTKCPSIIIEPEFIHRKELIQTNMERCCAVISDALEDYCG